jgi:hypothetical protein
MQGSGTTHRETLDFLRIIRWKLVLALLPSYRGNRQTISSSFAVLDPFVSSWSVMHSCAQGELFLLWREEIKVSSSGEDWHSIVRTDPGRLQVPHLQDVAPAAISFSLPSGNRIFWSGNLGISWQSSDVTTPGKFSYSGASMCHLYGLVWPSSISDALNGSSWNAVWS